MRGAIFFNVDYWHKQHTMDTVWIFKQCLILF